MRAKYTILLCIVISQFSYSQHWNLEHFNVEKGLPDNYVYAFEKHQKEIYVATDGGLVRFDGENFKPFYKEDIKSPVSLLSINDSHLYIGSWQDGVLVGNNKPFKNICKRRINRILKIKNKNILFNSYSKNAFLTIKKPYTIDTIISYPFEDKNRQVAINDSSIFIASNHHVSEYNWSGKRIRKISVGNTIDIPALGAIDNFLFSGNSEGEITWMNVNDSIHFSKSYKFEKQYKIARITPYSQRKILVQLNFKKEQNHLFLVSFDSSYTKVVTIESLLTLKNGISDIFIDEKTIYVAVYGDGFYKISPSFFKNYNKNDFQIPVPKYMYEDKNGNMVFCTENTFYTFKSKKKFEQKENLFRLNSLFSLNNKRYFSSYSRLFNENLNPVLNHRIDDILYATKNDTLYYSKYFFGRFNYGKHAEMYCIHENRSAKQINDGSYFQNNIYLGTQNGIVKFKKNIIGDWETTHDSILSTHFKGEVIRKLDRQKDRLLIATSSELFAYKNEKITSLFSTNINTYINALFITKNNTIFLGTNKGFWVFTKNDRYHFNSKNGINSDYIYSFYQDKNDVIWIITGSGFTEFNLNNLKKVKPPKIEINKKNIKNNNALISFKSINLHYPNEISFEYKLNNSLWRKLKDHQLEMNNLYPGNYNLSIRGKRINSNWSKPIITSFKITPKWYQFTSIKISILLILIVLLISFFLFRLKVIKQRNSLLSNEIQKRIQLENKVTNLREEIARDFHDEIGNKIASVIGLSNIIKTKEGIQSSKIEKITELSKEVYNTTKDFVWSLNPKNNNLESLCKYLRDYGEVFFDLFDEIDFLYTETNISPIEIPYLKSRNIILAYKEILSNILKHAKATKVHLRTSLLDNEFIIQINDNGIGIKNHDKEKGNGFNNITKRMEIINAKVDIKNEEGLKYTFRIKFPKQ